MHDQPTCGPALSEAALDDQMQISVLSFLLDLYPASLTFDEVLAEFTGLENGPFGEQDRISRAVRDLACSGLLHRHDEFLVPTRAATRFGAIAHI